MLFYRKILKPLIYITLQNKSVIYFYTNLNERRDKDGR